MRVPAGKLRETAGRLADSGLLETFQKNYQYSTQAVPNDPIYTRETHLPQIHAEQAWDLSVGSADIVVGIVDTGVDPDHPDLVDKIIDGWNVYDGNARFDDVLGHGTQVAGVAAAASNNAVGVAGVAWESPISRCNQCKRPFVLAKYRRRFWGRTRAKSSTSASSLLDKIGRRGSRRFTGRSW